MQHRIIREHWQSEDYKHAREMITQTRKEMHIYQDGVVMTDDEAKAVHHALVRQGENMAAEYLKVVYCIDV